VSEKNLRGYSTNEKFLRLTVMIVQNQADLDASVAIR
jgi:hypothetical protein